MLDADALFELEPGEWRAPVVMTPHAGELGRLLGEESSWVSEHRLEAVRRAASRFDCVCLLKGVDTLVANPAGDVLVVDADAPQLATAGTGDVLTGILAAYLAQGPRAAAAAAAAATAPRRRRPSCAVHARRRGGGRGRGAAAHTPLAVPRQLRDAVE